ncbi:hypothetical protein F66182_6700 [Fusarium sp. NRRL 66182]|nr:hypothetical protein F66182_6700 [Fusarium sp. NRRL 66182]
MKFTLLLAAAYMSCTLAAPITDKGAHVEDGKLPPFRMPRVGVTTPATTKHSSNADTKSRTKRAVDGADDLVNMMGRVAGKIKTRCDGVNTALGAVMMGNMSKTRAVLVSTRLVDKIRAVLSEAVSGLHSMPNMVLTHAEHQEIAFHIYTITHELYEVNREHIETLDGSGGRCLSRTAHMLADVLENLVGIDPDVAPYMVYALAPIFPIDSNGEIEHDDGLLDVVMSSVTSFLSNNKVDNDDDFEHDISWSESAQQPLQ